MENTISFEEFERFGANSEEDIELAIRHAKLKPIRKIQKQLQTFEDSFDAKIRTKHFQDAYNIQIEALTFIKEDSKSDWPLFFSEMFRYYPPKGLFGYYGRVVAALYISEEILELIRHLDQFIPADEHELTAENVIQTNGELTKIREPLSKAGNLSTTELRKIVPDLSVRGVDWRLRLLERSREISITDDVISWVPNSERYSKAKVPTFSMYYASYADMNVEQRAFYNEIFKPKFLSGEEVDVDNNWSYVFVLLHEMIRQRKKFKEDLPDALNRAIRMAKNESLGFYALSWLADLRFAEGDIDGGFEILNRENPNPNYVVARAIMVPEHRLEARELISLTQGKQGLATVGKRQFNEVSFELQQRLDEFHKVNGKSLVADLWDRIVDHVGQKKKLSWEREEGSPFVNEDKAKALLKGTGLLFQLKPPIQPFFGVSVSNPPTFKWPKNFPELGYEGVRELFSLRMRAEIRKAENKHRENIGLPRVGEGWVSEMQLLNEIREAFPEYWIEHQGRPSWLKQQSLDIYFPKLNIGIEYQGAQHSRPVDFFGGKTSFEAQQERDQRKRELCRQNGCLLIEVHPGYEINDVIEKIKKSLL